MHPDYTQFQQTYIFHLLQRFKLKHIGIVVLPNKNVSILNNGVMSIGSKLPKGCYHDRYYDYTSLQYPGRQWIFTLRSLVFRH